MKAFMDKDFLLKTETARMLYHEHASDMPIFDYHCHINVDEIFNDAIYDNITQVWLYGDHYKWRAMRLCGIDEEFITGNASDYNKFLAFSEIMPLLIGNPIFHWTHMELKFFFDIDIPLNRENSKEIWKITKKKLQGGYSVRHMIRDAHVRKICSTDDPLDMLEYHRSIKEDVSFDIEVLPSFRPDKGIEIGEKTFVPWVHKLANVSGRSISDYNDFLICLDKRLEYFDYHGCVLADHGLDKMSFSPYAEKEIKHIFNKGLSGSYLTELEKTKYRSAVLSHLAESYYHLGWVMQLHIGAMRSNNRQMHDSLGPDTGFDSINDYSIAESVSQFMDQVHDRGLPKTIIYSLNPKDNYVLGSMMGNFPWGSYGTHVQLGCAWWFNDHIDGMTDHLRTFSNLGVLPRFAGMLTDSRSFLSYARHDYFRRILCNFLGELVENGEYPQDMKRLGSMVEDISYNNACTFINKSNDI